MTDGEKSILKQKARAAIAALRNGWSVMLDRGPSQIQFWFIALIIGIAAGFAALFFRKGIMALQGLVYGTEDMSRIHSVAETLPWYWVLSVPILGGLVVGLILHHMTDDARVRSVSDVI